VREFQKGKEDHGEDNTVRGIEWATKLKLRASQVLLHSLLPSHSARHTICFKLPSKARCTRLYYSQAATVATNVLSDAGGVERLQADFDDLKADVNQFTKELSQRWGERLVRIAQEDSSESRSVLGTWTDLDMAADGKLGVKFSSRLAGTVRDAQALNQLGFEPSREVRELATDADKYYFCVVSAF
jgi:hypothetical protein